MTKKRKTTQKTNKTQTSKKKKREREGSSTDLGIDLGSALDHQLDAK